MQNRKVLTETIDIGDIDVSLAGNCVIQEVDDYRVRVEMDIEIVRMGIKETGELLVERFSLIEKKLEVYGKVEDGEHYWREAKSHVRWLLQGFTKISDVASERGKDYYFGESLMRAEKRVWGDMESVDSVDDDDDGDEDESGNSATIASVIEEERRERLRYWPSAFNGFPMSDDDMQDEDIYVVPFRERKWDEVASGCQCEWCVSERVKEAERLKARREEK